MSHRTFTLDEAQTLLPVLESLLRTAITGKQLMEEVEGEMQSLSHRIFLNGGTHVDVVAVARRKISAYSIFPVKWMAAWFCFAGSRGKNR
jgi:hypothetical protein